MIAVADDVTYWLTVHHASRNGGLLTASYWRGAASLLQ